MEYVYAALLIHKAGGKIDEGTVKKVLEASGKKPDDARVKALVASMDGVDIDKAIEKAASVAAPAPQASAPAAAGGSKAEKKEEKKEEKKSEEEAAAGLSALFG